MYSPMAPSAAAMSPSGPIYEENIMVGLSCITARGTGLPCRLFEARPVVVRDGLCWFDGLKFTARLARSLGWTDGPQPALR